jgi:primosomal protein N' (replication factor Y)
MAALSGTPSALAEFLAAARLPADADLLGPVPEPSRPGQEGERERYLVRVPAAEGAALARALAQVQGVRSAKKAPSTSGAAGPARPGLRHGRRGRSVDRTV